MVGDAMRDLPREERFAAATERCHREIDSRRAQWLVVWCDQAAREAVNQRNRERRDVFSEEETALLWDVAWLQAIEGVQDNSFFAAPLIDRVSLTDEAGPRRLIAYRLLSNLRGRDLSDSERYMLQLAELESVNIEPQRTLLSVRRQVLDALLAQPATPDRLWAVAAATLTYTYEYRNATIAPDELALDAKQTADALGPLLDNATALTGNDRALQLLLLNARIVALTVARDFEAASDTVATNAANCEEMLWNGSVLCLDLHLNAAYAGVMRQLVAEDPQGMALPPEAPISSRQYGQSPIETWCRAIIIGDVSDEGEFVNAQVAYENPRNVCRSMALNYATARRYRPVVDAQPGARRTNIVLRFVLTAP